MADIYGPKCTSCHCLSNTHTGCQDFYNGLEFVVRSPASHTHTHKKKNTENAFQEPLTTQAEPTPSPNSLPLVTSYFAVSSCSFVILTPTGPSCYVFHPLYKILRNVPLSCTLQQPSALYPMATPFFPSLDKQHTKGDTPNLLSKPCSCLSYANLFTVLLDANPTLSRHEVGISSLFTLRTVREIYHGGELYTVTMNSQNLYYHTIAQFYIYCIRFYMFRL